MEKHCFGGEWTIKKLIVIKKYLDFFTTALKNQNFVTMYIDAFAGNGKVYTKDGKELDGSVTISLQTNPPFDKYIFIEKNPQFAMDLHKIKQANPNKDIIVYNNECNDVLKEICASYDWTNHRAVLFLDPYSTQVSWETIKIVASTKAIDVWYLFPINALSRMLEKHGNIPQSTRSIINKLIGDEKWYDILYEEDPQLNLFEEESKIKIFTTKMLADYVNNRLDSIFASVAPNPLILCNSKNSPLFLLCFAIANPSEKAINLALRGAKYILNNKNICS